MSYVEQKSTATDSHHFDQLSLRSYPLKKKPLFRLEQTSTIISQYKHNYVESNLMCTSYPFRKATVTAFLLEHMVFDRFAMPGTGSIGHIIVRTRKAWFECQPAIHHPRSVTFST